MAWRVTAESLESIAADALIVLLHDGELLAQADSSELRTHLNQFRLAVTETETTRREWFCTLPRGAAATRHLLLESTAFDAPLLGREALRATATRCVATCRAYSLRRLAIGLRGAPHAPALAAVLMEAMEDAAWVDDRLLPPNAPPPEPLELIFAVHPAEQAIVHEALSQAAHVLESALLARQIAGSPPSLASPGELTEQLSAFSRRWNLETTLMDEAGLLRAGRTLALSHGGRSTRVMILRYRPLVTSHRAAPAIVACGRLRPAPPGRSNEYGAIAAAFGAFHAHVRAQSPLPVTLVLHLSEGPFDGPALLPGERLLVQDGRVVSVRQEDHGNLLPLAEGLTLARQETDGPLLAVLSSVPQSGWAFGTGFGAISAQTSERRDELLQAAGAAGEQTWSLPLRQGAQADSTPDLTHSGGAVHAASFLVAWVGWESDLAVLDLSAVQEHHGDEGASGAGVRTLARWLAAQAR